MKKICTFALASLFLLLTACGQVAPPETGLSVEYSYAEPITSVADMMSYSTNVVRATLESAEDFDGAVQVYLFRVTDDFTGNTPDEIHVYDARNSGYVKGDSYYLFLCSGESALFPHTIYTTVAKDMILKADGNQAATAIDGHNIAVSSDSLLSLVESASAAGRLGDKAEESVPVSASADIGAVAAQADVVALIRVSGENNANAYASTYTVETVSARKGAAEAVPSSMNLPAGLTSGADYYIFLKNVGGSYVLFSRSFPAVPADSVSAAALISE